MPNATPDPLVPSRPTTKKNKIVTTEDAVRLIKDGDVVAMTGIVGCVSAEQMLEGIEQAFLKEGRPRDLTLIIASWVGNTKSRSVGTRLLEITN